MDQATLVTIQIEDGQRLVERLAQGGFSVTAAGWIKASEDGQWFLYLASPVVDKQGDLRAYRQVNPMVRQMPQPFSIDPFEIKLIGAATPLAQEMAAIGAYIYTLPISSQPKNKSE